MEYGSEFKHHKILETIFLNHPLWSRLESQLKYGVDFPAEPQDFQSRRQDTIEALDFGNHKGASNHPALLETMMTKDVTAGYSLVSQSIKYYTSREHLCHQ